MPGMNLPKGFDAKAHKEAARKFANKLPQRDNCDLSDPKEMFLWMLVALPGMNGGQQAMPSAYNMLVSQHLFECGAMLQCPECGHAKLPEKAYVPTSADDPHWMTSPGTWTDPAKVPARDVDPLDDAIDKLTIQQQSNLYQRLLKRVEDGSLRPEGN